MVGRRRMEVRAVTETICLAKISKHALELI
jgi:hypothetical protein